MAGSKNVESALDWLLSHENDNDIDEPIKKVPKGQTLASSGPVQVAKSIKCVETGRLFRNAMEAQAYAERTGRTQFEETTEVKKPLTEEEKKTEGRGTESTGGAASSGKRRAGKSRRY